MSTELQMAQAELVADVRREINWFVPPGQRHFVDPAAIATAASVLLGVFFAGVAKEMGSEAGKAVGKWIAERLRSVTSGKESADQAEVERDAETAKATLKGVERERATLVFDQVETELRSGLTEVMPEQRAANFATRVRHIAVKVIYETEGAS
jgi:hypothetical protein